MDEMKCPICGKTLSWIDNKCPRCSFQIINLADSSAKNLNLLNAIAEEYRKRFWLGWKVKIKVYKNDLDDNGHVTATEEYIDLCDTEKMKPSLPVWYGEQFVRLSGPCRIDGRIENKAGEIKPFSTLIDDPDTESLWQIGAWMDKADKIRLLIGGKDKYVRSDLIDLSEY